LNGFVDVQNGSGRRHADESFQAYIHRSNESFVGRLGGQTNFPIRMADSIINVVEVPFASDMVRVGSFSSMSDTVSDGLSVLFSSEADDSIDILIGMNTPGRRVEAETANESEGQLPCGGSLEWADLAECLGCSKTVCQESWDYFHESQKNMTGFLDQLPSKEARRVWDEWHDGACDFSPYLNEIEKRQFDTFYERYLLSSQSFLFHCTALCQGRPW
jgi:hypothetical protein